VALIPASQTREPKTIAISDKTIKTRMADLSWVAVKDHSDTLGPTVVGATCSGFSSMSAVSFVPLQLSLAPTRVFARRIEFALTCRLSAFMTPIRANIVGPPFSATSNSASTALCHSGAFFSFGLSAEM
jgi:hypothetical protein